MMPRAILISVGFAAAVAFSGSCSSSTVSGSPTTQSVAAVGTNFGTNFNACTDLTDADIKSYGLNPSTKQDTTSQNGGLGQSCDWTNENVLTSFAVGGRTIDQLKNDPRYLSTTSIQIGGRESVRIITEPAPGICGIGLPTGSASVVLSLTIKHSALPTAGDPCALVTDIANKFVTKLPK